MNKVIGKKYTRELTPLEDELAGVIEAIGSCSDEEQFKHVWDTLARPALNRAMGIKNAAAV